MEYLSFLMGADKITDFELTNLGVEIIAKDSEGERKLKISPVSVPGYTDLIKSKLNLGYWNDIVGSKDIIFIFKSQDGVVKNLNLTLENEKEISELCTQYNKDPIEKTANVYKYLAGNGFYKGFMEQYYADLINR